MIQLSNQGLVAFPSEEETNRLRSRFDRQHALLLPQLVAPDFLKHIQSRIRQAHFSEIDHPKVGARDSNLEDELTVQALHFLANAPNFLEVITKITGCDGIQCFSGRVAQMRPDRHHLDVWHTDMSDQRLVGISVNLAETPYSGGVFKLRDMASEHVLWETANTGPGDAMLFRIAPFLQHKVSRIDGTASRTAFVGWFRSANENFHDLARSQAGG